MEPRPVPEDIREYASQVLRAGGQGVIYYAIDMPQYKYIRYTDPVRWATMMEIADQLHTLPRLSCRATPRRVFGSARRLSPRPGLASGTMIPTSRMSFSEKPSAHLSVTYRTGGWNAKVRSEFGDVKILYVANAKYVPVRRTGPIDAVGESWRCPGVERRRFVHAAD